MKWQPFCSKLSIARSVHAPVCVYMCVFFLCVKGNFFTITTLISWSQLCVVNPLIPLSDGVLSFHLSLIRIGLIATLTTDRVKHRWPGSTNKMEMGSRDTRGLDTFILTGKKTQPIDNSHALYVTLGMYVSHRAWTKWPTFCWRYFYVGFDIFNYALLHQFFFLESIRQ